MTAPAGYVRVVDRSSGPLAQTSSRARPASCADTARGWNRSGAGPGGLQDAGSSVRYLIRDRDGKYPAALDAILAGAGITVVRSGVWMPRMNAIIKRWVRTCRRELLDRTLIWNQGHLLYALHEFATVYNQHRAHQGIANTRPLKPLPEPIADPDRLTRLTIHRRDRLGGILREYEHAA